MKNYNAYMLAVIAVVAGIGCIQVKTESEIKPIHITMDVNLKVDKELDRTFAGEDQQKPQGDYAVIRSMLDRKVAGYTNKAMLEAREGATDDDRIAIAEDNVKRMKRFRDVAQKSGTSIDEVQKRRLIKLREKAAAGTWMQDDDGKWSQKK